jgi:hypothetical protein
MTYWPKFLDRRDPEALEWKAWMRRCYENRTSDDRLPRHWQTLDDVLEEANLLAQQVLPEVAES